MSINNDMLTRSLAQLADDPATEAEASLKSAQFAAALRRLDTDPNEAARIDAIANEADHDVLDQASLREADLDVEELGTDPASAHESPDFSWVGSATGSGKTTSRVISEEARASVGKRLGRATNRKARLASIGDSIHLAVIVVMAVCATTVAIFAASTATSSFVATFLTVASVTPVLARSAILLMATGDLIRRKRSDEVLRIMKGESLVVTRRSQRR
jgi:hypothetical protein